MAIAVFPNFQPLSLAERGEIQGYLAQHPPDASEYTFTNLFAWRRVRNHQVARYGNGFAMLKELHGERSFVQPLVPNDRDRAVHDCLAFLIEQGGKAVIERVEEAFIQGLAMPDQFEITEDRDQFDYLYLIEELIALPGNRFHDKKNLIAQFRKNYKYRYLPLTEELAQQCIAFEHAWCDERRCAETEGLAHEDNAVLQMLAHFHELDLQGGALEIEGNIIAFTLAERLNPETMVIHVEKAKSNIVGAYQAMNWEFLRHAAREYRYVNREQDLGVNGLRRAKLSYNPRELVKKYRITPRESVDYS